MMLTEQAFIDNVLLFNEETSSSPPVIVSFSDYLVSRKAIENSSSNIIEEKKELLDEKTIILFNNGQRFGQIVFLVGGSGSGKGFARKRFIETEKFVIRDVDEWKREVMKLDSIAASVVNPKKSQIQGVSSRKATTKAIQNLRNMGKNIDLLDQEMIDKIDARKLNLKKSKDVFKLHLIVKALGIKDKTLNLLLGNATNKDRLPNILFDITFSKMEDIADLLPRLQNIGYSTRSIHLVWVLANFHMAVVANKTRDRVVPNDIVLNTHRGAATNMIQVISGKVPRGLDGKIEIILNNRENTIPWTDSAGKIIKRGGAIIVKSFLSLTVKKEGKPITKEKNILATVFNWIKNNIPSLGDKKNALIDAKAKEFASVATKNANSIRPRVGSIGATL